MTHIKTMCDLRRETEDTPDTMAVCVQIPGVSRFVHINKIVWMDERCVFVLEQVHPSSPNVFQTV